MENIIDLYSVSDLLKKKFYIPCYQRGYRWTEQQVRELLNDINDFDLTTDKVTGKKNWYCLQPLVVKDLSNFLNSVPRFGALLLYICTRI